MEENNENKKVIDFEFDWIGKDYDKIMPNVMAMAKKLLELNQIKVEKELKRKRQYKIENNKLVRVFDNDLNVVDECLQEVLSEKSSDKYNRLMTLCNPNAPEQKVKDEKIDDTILDLANYCLLWLVEREYTNRELQLFTGAFNSFPRVFFKGHSPADLNNKN